MAKKSRIGLGLEVIGLLTAVVTLLSGIVELLTKVVSYGRRHSQLQIRVPT